MAENIYEYNSSKEYLARLLAKENISVMRSPTYSTAFFDLQGRVMHLPIWKTTEEVYDLLTIHEMAHALFTPTAGWHTAVCDNPTKKSYYNIIEDARIEKLIKRRYAGAVNTFREGYKQLNDDDFFGIVKHNIDVSKASLIDRINIYYKMGSLIHVRFSEKESVWIQRIDAAETWEDVVKIADELFDFSKENALTEIQAEIVFDENGKKIEGNKSAECEGNDNSHGKEGGDGISSLTDEEYRHRMYDYENKASHTGYDVPAFLRVGDVDSSKWVVNASKTRELLNSLFVHFHEKVTSVGNEFMNKQKAVVNTMVKEFEAKKRASSYARNQWAKSGRLDMKKLAKYQLAEDIFRRNIIEQKGKNHSMVMIVDWSGSMGAQLYDTVVQTINLAMFCRKAGIPFSVQIMSNHRHPFCEPPRYNEKATYGVHNNVTMFEVLSSDSNNQQFNKDVHNFYALSFVAGRRDYESSFSSDELNIVQSSKNARFFWLGGTPLNAALVVTADFVSKFRARTKSEVTNVIVLTDGESCGNNHQHHRKTQVFDDKTGVTYFSKPYDTIWETNMCYDLIRDRNQGRVNIIGYFVSSPYDVKHMSRRYTGDYNITVKNGFHVVHKNQFMRADRFYLVANNKIKIDDEWDFEDEPFGAKREDVSEKEFLKDVKKSFSNHTASKRNARVVLSKFIEDVAAKIA